MDSNTLQEILIMAEDSLEEAEKWYKRAEKAFTEEWNQKYPNGSETDLNRFLEKELKSWSEQVRTELSFVERSKRNYEMSIQRPGKELCEIKTLLKRLVEAKESNGSRKRHCSDSAFQNRLIERDGCCVITGSFLYEATHIVPFEFANDYSHLWKQLYQQYCFNQDHKVKVDDVRNGLLLSPVLHTLFEHYLFTIFYEDGKYFIKKSRYFPIPDLEESEIKFNGDPALLPSTEFLAFHNGQFEAIVNQAREDIESFDMVMQLFIILKL